MIKYLALIFIVVEVSACGGSSYEKKYHLVTAIIDGNTIELDGRAKRGTQTGVQIDLIGIQNTRASMEYLKQNLLDQRVRIVFDTKHRRKITHSRDKAPAYVVTFGKLALNGEIIKQGLSGIDNNFLTDSLSVFKTYAGGGYDEIAYEDYYTEEVVNGDDDEFETEYDEPTPIRPSAPTQGEPAVTTSVDLPGIISQVKPAVFIIYNSRHGNQNAQGTGFFISSYGLAVSNYHVVENSEQLNIKTSEEKWYFIDEIIASNREQDYAIFNVVSITNDFKYLRLADGQPAQGEEIFVMGNPMGLESTVTKGIISAIRNTGQLRDFIQIDAAISPGSSGSPVFNRSGEVVGMATKFIADGCQNCNFALRASIIKRAKEKIDF